MNYKMVEEIHAKRCKIVNQMMDITLSTSPADEPEELAVKMAAHDALKLQLEALPTLEEAGQVPAKMGRPSVIKNGVKRQVAVTLPAEDWEHIAMLIDTGRVGSYAEYFRDLHESSLSDFQIDEDPNDQDPNEIDQEHFESDFRDAGERDPRELR